MRSHHDGMCGICILGFVEALGIQRLHEGNWDEDDNYRNLRNSYACSIIGLI